MSWRREAGGRGFVDGGDVSIRADRADLNDVDDGCGNVDVGCEADRKATGERKATWESKPATAARSCTACYQRVTSR